MKITDIEYQIVKVRLRNPLVLAYGTLDTLDTVIIKMFTDTSLYGYGESSTIAYVTGETPETILAVLDMFRKQLIGMNPLSIAEIHSLMDGMIHGNTAAKAGIDIALYDILGKRLEQPLYKLLGGSSNRYQTDIMVGIDTPERMAEKARHYLDEGISMLKVKAGHDVKQDIEAAKQIRRAVGADVVLRIDANQGWSAADTLAYLDALKDDVEIEAIEQPLPAWNLEGHAELRKKMGRVKLILDESVKTPKDAVRAVRQNAADMFSIKLEKAGGIYRALQINTIAENSGIECLVGCMPVSDISLSAAAHLTASQKNITVGDTDSHFLIDEKRIEGSFRIEEGWFMLSDEPGLGVMVNL